MILKMPGNIRVRSRAVILVLLPVTTLLWLVGWTLYWTGSRTKPQKPKPTPQTDTMITTAILLENEEYNT
ncbi:MAG: hypothetical protein ABSD73_10520 [Candidatus Bathyarchaeia archaeon]|jgi:hypothetical protein